MRSQKKSPNPHFPIGRSGTDVDGDDGICPHSSRRTNNCQDTLSISRLGVVFINIFTHGFYASSSPKHKNSVKLSVCFCSFGIYARKTYVEH